MALAGCIRHPWLLLLPRRHPRIAVRLPPPRVYQLPWRIHARLCVTLQARRGSCRASGRAAASRARAGRRGAPPQPRHASGALPRAVTAHSPTLGWLWRWCHPLAAVLAVPRLMIGRPTHASRDNARVTTGCRRQSKAAWVTKAQQSPRTWRSLATALARTGGAAAPGAQAWCTRGHAIIGRAQARDLHATYARLHRQHARLPNPAGSRCIYMKTAELYGFHPSARSRASRTERLSPAPGAPWQQGPVRS